jgi:hypothetical protein
MQGSIGKSLLILFASFEVGFDVKFTLKCPIQKREGGGKTGQNMENIFTR